jgi:ribonucleoside-diphosphate reductase alpha chain
MAKSLVDYIFRYMATKFLNRDEQDQVGIINRQMTLTEASPIGGEGAAAVAPTSPAGATDSAGAAAPATSSPATDTSESTQRADEGSASVTAQPEPATEDVSEAASGAEASGLMDGLKIVAQNGHAKGDASREDRLNVGQAPVIFDTADSPACTECGSIMVRNGSCYKCINCGATSGCS